MEEQTGRPERPEKNLSLKAKETELKKKKDEFYYFNNDSGIDNKSYFPFLFLPIACTDFTVVSVLRCMQLIL